MIISLYIIKYWEKTIGGAPELLDDGALLWLRDMNLVEYVYFVLNTGLAKTYYLCKSSVFYSLKMSITFCSVISMMANST